MTLEDPKTGREVFVYYDCWAHVGWGQRLRCGNAWYVAPGTPMRWWQDLERLEVVK